MLEGYATCGHEITDTTFKTHCHMGVLRGARSKVDGLLGCDFVILVGELHGDGVHLRTHFGDARRRRNFGRLRQIKFSF